MGRTSTTASMVSDSPGKWTRLHRRAAAGVELQSFLALPDGPRHDCVEVGGSLDRREGVLTRTVALGRMRTEGHLERRLRVGAPREGGEHNHGTEPLCERALHDDYLPLEPTPARICEVRGIT